MIIAEFDNNVEVKQISHIGFSIFVDGIETLERSCFEDHKTNFAHAMHDAKEVSEKLGDGTYICENGKIRLSH